MKKFALGALALATLTTPCFAQSSVTLFGIVDANVLIGKGSGAGSSDRTQISNSGDASSRLGFRGTEDLGGGMSASFWLEAGLSNDNGAGVATNTNNQSTGGAVAGIGGGQGLTFNRRSTLSLAGAWGELRLGRYLTPHFLNLTVFDPFTATGMATTQTLNGVSSTATGASSLNIIGSAAVRGSNAVGYLLPRNLGGFYGEVMHFRGENVSTGAATDDDGNGTSLRLGWAGGAANVAASIARIGYARTATTGDVSVFNIGGSYDFGPAVLMGHYVRDRVDATVERRATGGLIGVNIPAGAGLVRVAYSSYKVSQGATSPSSRKLAAGYLHNLSKRTALYVNVARVNNRDGANASLGGAVTAVNNSSSGYEFGVRHSF